MKRAPGRKTKTAPKTRAELAGESDGAVRAIIKPDDFDPTGGFIKRTELTEAERREYVDAYDRAFMDALRVMRPESGCFRKVVL